MPIMCNNEQVLYGMISPVFDVHKPVLFLAIVALEDIYDHKQLITLDSQGKLSGRQLQMMLWLMTVFWQISLARFYGG